MDRTWNGKFYEPERYRYRICFLVYKNINNYRYIFLNTYRVFNGSIRFLMIETPFDIQILLVKLNNLVKQLR